MLILENTLYTICLAKHPQKLRIKLHSYFITHSLLERADCEWDEQDKTSSSNFQQGFKDE